MITLTASASCLRCDWTASGDWAGVDRSAEKHTRSAEHPTTTSAKPTADQVEQPDRTGNRTREPNRELKQA